MDFVYGEYEYSLCRQTAFAVRGPVACLSIYVDGFVIDSL